MRALIIGIKFEEIDLHHDDAVNKIMEDFDTSNDHKINETEFVIGISGWLNKKILGTACNAGPDFIDFHKVN